MRMNSQLTSAFRKATNATNATMLAQMPRINGTAAPAPFDAASRMDESVLLI